MVKCLTHGFRGFNDAVQRRLATLTVTMLISWCWQLSSEVELRRIFDVCKRWANSGSHEFVKKNMVRYMRPHGRFAHCSCKNAAGSCCIFTLAVRQPPVLASCIEIYYCTHCAASSRNVQIIIRIFLVFSICYFCLKTKCRLPFFEIFFFCYLLNIGEVDMS